MKSIYIVVLLSLSYTYTVSAQSPRINHDRNNIGWLTYTGTVKLHEHWSVHTEYQFRRVNWGAAWQQSLLRLGLNRQISKNLSATAGYAEVETFRYGEYPFNKGDKPFSEHRIFQQFQIKHTYGTVDLTSRYRLEQRWIEKQKNDGSPDGWRYTNRFRYMLRGDIPLGKKLYVAAYDELFIGFGDQIKYNMFDQNRFALMLGCKFGPLLKLEGGFFSQIVQQGNLHDVSYLDNISGMYNTVPSTVMQYNSGFIFNAVCLFDMTGNKSVN